ncbi:MAG: peptide-methionine (R)-S-oxide reductase [Saprospiraceae bacterium]|jgi:peptide-methionine (R)-S-oxide reductase
MLTWNDVLKIEADGNLTPDIRIEKTEQEWKSILTPEQFRITRLKGTERSNTGAYCKIYDPGNYACICCETKLFGSAVKYDSGTGWPSFSQPVKENAVKYEKDDSLGMTRVEAMCNTCDAHLGHVFKFGPKPSGLRYCINSESIKLLKDDK